MTKLREILRLVFCVIPACVWCAAETVERESGACTLWEKSRGLPHKEYLRFPLYSGEISHGARFSKGDSSFFSVFFFLLLVLYH